MDNENIYEFLSKKMKTTIIYCGIPFLISFATASGELNENFYIKLFVFELLFVLMYFLYISRVRHSLNNSALLSVSFADVMALALLGLYLYYCIGYCNIIDHSLPLTYFLFYFFIRFCGKVESFDVLSDIALIIILLHLLWCLLQYVEVLPNNNRYFKVASSFGNPDMLSAFLAVLLPLCYQGSKWKVLRILILVLTIGLFFFLQARTAIVASMITLLIYYFSKRSVPKIYIIIAVVAMVLGVVLLIFWYNKSVLGRFYIWIVSLSMLLGKPFGWGLYAYEKYYPEYQSKFTMENPDIVNLLNYDVVHSPYNEFLNVAVCLGIVGLLLYLMFVVYILISAYKTKSFLFFPLLTFQVVSLSYFPFKIIPLTVVYLLCSALVVSVNKNCLYQLLVSVKLLRRISFCIVSVVLICFMSNLYGFNYWRKAIGQSANHETFSLAAGSFEKCFPFLSGNGRFLISYAELLYRMRNEQESFVLMHRAEKYFSDINFLHDLAVVYEMEGDMYAAKNKFNMAVNMSPDNIRIAFAQIQFLDRIGETEEVYRLTKLLIDKIKKKKNQDPQERLILKSMNKYLDISQHKFQEATNNVDISLIDVY